MKRISLAAFAIIISTLANLSRADTFGRGASSFEIPFVTIGQPGNAPDGEPNPAGAVTYTYRIGKYEISEQMIEKANAAGALGITKDVRGPDKPATSITWFEAAQFVNWLNTSTGATPAYKFDSAGNFKLWLPSDPGYNSQNLFRNSLARYFLPSVDEWHKAAYYDPAAGHYWDYPTGSDAIPDGIDFVGDPNFDAVFFDGALNPEPNNIVHVGLLSPYGSAGQGGNVREWHETAFDRVNNNAVEQRSDPGGSWAGPYSALTRSNSGIGVGPLFEGDFNGFRVAAIVPEPSASILIITASTICFMRSNIRKKTTIRRAQKW